MSDADAAPAVDTALASVLPPGALFAVGGRVRDELRTTFDGIARPAQDLDYVVVGITLEDLIGRLGRLGRANVVGASFAVIKATIEGRTVDIALPRRERSTGVGHRDFHVESGPDVTLADDLARRDFRMNMLARALPTGEVVDPYGGASDLAARRIDILAEQTFEEDPLRMLRAAQFAARFEYAVTPRTLAAMRGAAHLVGSVSPERIRDELRKLLTARRPSLGLELMRESGLLERVLPELAEGVGVEQNAYHAYDVYAHNLATADAVGTSDSILRLAALLHDVGKPRTKEGPHFYRHAAVGEDLSMAVMERLHFPDHETATVAGLVRHHMYSVDPAMTDGAVRRFIRRVGPENLARQFELRHADIVGSGLPKRGDDNERFEARVAQLLAEVPALSVADLSLNGNDILAAAVRRGRLSHGSRGGAVVGNVLRELLNAVLDDPSLNERTALMRLTERLLDGEP